MVQNKEIKVDKSILAHLTTHVTELRLAMFETHVTISNICNLVWFLDSMEIRFQTTTQTNLT